MKNLTIEGDKLMLGEEPIQIISGAIHYFRVVPEYWEDRLLKLKACGFNTVETYVPWNFHEPNEGQFIFDGMADIERFIRTAGDLGLYVIVRPSPYICSEWEFGGLPAWLLADRNMRFRCLHQPFLDKVDAYYDELIPRLAALQTTKGGPIIAMQIENEYGSFGNDTPYLEYSKQALLDRGIDVLLFTSDGPEDFMLLGGMVPGVWETANFGSRAEESFTKLKIFQPDKPLMCMEYWNGWFDHWGKEHQTRDAGDVAQVLDDMLSQGASVNFYMFHGGTNFGFWNGANHDERYWPTVTSYDYDSPLSESGDITEKYLAVREVVAKYKELGPLELPEPIAKKSYGTVTMDEQASLFDSLDQLTKPVQSTCPEPMEKFGQNYGFIMYSTTINGPRFESTLNLQEVRDRALVFLDGEYKGTYERWDKETEIKFAIPAEGARLDVLVENLGRVNYGTEMNDPKGITEGIRLGQQFLYHWTVHNLPMIDLSALQYGATTADHNSATGAPAIPAFYRGHFEVSEIGDTFLNMNGWGKGVAYINGFNLGRYWEAGPQQTLYVPGPLLRQGSNELVIFELHHTDNREGAQPQVVLQDFPVLG